MSEIPKHTASQYLAYGVALHMITPDRVALHAPVTDSHQDDFYIFGVMKSGRCQCVVDFREITLSAGDVVVIFPGQVHRFLSASNAEGVLLMADSRLVGNKDKCVFDNFVLFASAFREDIGRIDELWKIATLMDRRQNRPGGQRTDAVVSHLAEAFIAIISASVQGATHIDQARHSQRHIEIVLAFRRLLTECLPVNRRPSYYASRLCISTVYLNEVVKGVTGMSTVQYIKNEWVLRAKRLLVGTSLSVKQIANGLGFTDMAYFSRVFTASTGVSPMAFKRKHLE